MCICVLCTHPRHSSSVPVMIAFVIRGLRTFQIFGIMSKCSCGWGCSLSINIHWPFYIFQIPLKIGVATGQSSLQWNVSTSNMQHFQAWPTKPFYTGFGLPCFLWGWLGCPQLGTLGGRFQDCKAVVSTALWMTTWRRAIPPTWTSAQDYFVSRNKIKQNSH